MKLTELFKGIDLALLEGDTEIEIAGVEFDSRRVGKGSLFVAMRGAKADGNAHVSQAIESGAAAVVSEREPPGATRVPWAVAIDARGALARLAKNFYAAPDEELLLVGITGTNGKTTTAHILRCILNRCRGPAGMMGTIAHSTGSREFRAALTTPEAPDSMRLLREMRAAGCRSAVMEASSAAIDQRRVLGFAFDAVVFTNLTRDHLDYHGDMESYYRAKRKLFEQAGAKETKAVVNADDIWGRRLLKEITIPALTYGSSEGADVRIEKMVVSLGGTELDLATPMGRFSMKSRLIGSLNATNILAAFAAATALGLDGGQAAAAIEQVPTVRGRLERVAHGRPFEVLVDFAHTDDALRVLLETARELTEGRIIVLFGCGGDKDRGKRPLMGRHAVRLGDVAVLTSDNPRSEDPLAIIEDVRRGIEELPAGRAEYHVIPNRREAIRFAIGLARPGDLILLAGKGHEDYQITGDGKSPFDDREEALEALTAL